MFSTDINTERKDSGDGSRRFVLPVFALMLICGEVFGADGTTRKRPMLFFTDARIGQFRKRIEDDAAAKAAWDELLERARGMLDARLVTRDYAESGAGQHGNYGRPSSQMADMGGTLGLAYKMTGERKYARKLREAMLHYGTYSRWAGDAHHDPPWHSELNTARFCFGYAVAYDSIYDFLGAGKRKQIADSMLRLGILPTLNDWLLGGQRIHALDSMGHNWWSVCVSMAGLATLSILDDEPRADEWTRRIDDSFVEWFYYEGNILQNKSTNFDRKGAFYESVNYANYALSEYLLFRLAYSNVFSRNEAAEIGLLDTCGDLFIHTCYPTAESLLSVNFGDSSLRAGADRTLRMLLANGFDSEAYHWYLSKTDYRLARDPISLVYDCTRPVEDPPENLPQSEVYSDIGWGVMRSGWEDNATMLAVKSGFTWNHAHPDAGSFILFHNGKPLLIDSGNCSYSRREYTSYYRRSRAHNVILTDGVAQNPQDCAAGDRGTVTEGTVCNLLDAGGLKYVMADATGPTSWKFSRNYRHFLWVGDVILIFDDVRTHEAGVLEWLLHYDGGYDKDGNSIRIENGEEAAVLVKSLYPAGLQVAEKKGLRDHDPDTQVTYLSLSDGKSVREQKFITALLPLGRDGSESAIKLTLLEANEAIGVRITDGVNVTDIYQNLRADGRKMHRNSCNTIAGWETDAYLFAIQRPVGSPDEPGSVHRYFAACCSYLRKDDKVVLDSLSKVYTTFAVDSSGMMDIELCGQDVLNVALSVSKRPRAVSVNGQTVDASYNQNRDAVIVRMGKR